MNTVYRVRVSGEVAQTATGTRRRSIETAEGPRLLEFGKTPLFLPFLPPEVEQDPHLIVTLMSEDEMRQLRGKLTPLPLPGAEVQPPGGPHLPNATGPSDDQVIGAKPELLVEEVVESPQTTEPSTEPERPPRRGGRGRRR